MHDLVLELFQLDSVFSDELLVLELVIVHEDLLLLSEFLLQCLIFARSLFNSDVVLRGLDLADAAPSLRSMGQQ